MNTRVTVGLLAVASLFAGANRASAQGCQNCGDGSAHHHHLLDKGHNEEVAKYQRAQAYNWHGHYYDPAWGAPVALVVPPTAKREYNWGWGVGTTRLTRINHQFGRNYPGAAYGAGPFYPTPPWPWDTTQFGVYYVRGPW